MKTLKTLFLAWKNPIGNSWFTIGRLTFDGDKYQFMYTQGVKYAEQKFAFKALPSFPRLNEVYTSTQLFPVFSNRLMSHSRPDYSSFMQWLNLTDNESDPFAILARSGGERQTDTLAVFVNPEPDKQGQYHLYFFSRGLKNLTSSSIERINKFVPGEKLQLIDSITDPQYPQILTLITDDQHIVGNIPQYLFASIFEILQKKSSLEVRVEHLNQPPIPFQFRLLCRMILNINPFLGSQYQPLITEVATATTK